MNDLLKINDELSAFLKDFVELVATNDQCDVSLWLQEKGIEGKNEIVLLKKYYLVIRVLSIRQIFNGVTTCVICICII